MMAAAERNEERILILSSADTVPVGETLRQAGIESDVCATVDELTLRLEEGAGAVLLPEEVLRSDGVAALLAELKTQPAWSDIPFLLLTDDSVNPERLMSLAGDSANVTLLERPIRKTTLLSVIRSALRARRKQYEVRNYIEERRQIEEELRQTRKLESIGVLAGGVAHDFNNLLVGILGNASLAIDTLPKDSEAIPLLHDVVLAGQRAADLTRQLLAYSGKGHFHVTPVNVSDLVREISSLIQPSIPKMVRLRLDLDRNLPTIQADSSQLQQLVMNLVINGAEAIGAGRPGVVEVTTGVREVGNDDAPRSIPPTEIRPGRYVYLQVHDNGAGMDQRTLSKIFDPFFTTKFTGRGLGLAAALGIVRGHQGGIEVESDPGQGATFRVYFPAKNGHEPASKGDGSHDSLAGTGTILFVDDEEVVRNAARHCLDSYGYDALLAEDGREALEVFRRNSDRISLVILDMTMPVMGGEETARGLRKIRPDVKIILSSGYSEAETLERFPHGSVAGFIQKPYTASELGQKIKDLLSQK